MTLLRGYRAQFYMRTTDVTGRISSIMNDNDEEATVVMPGGRVKMVVELIMRLLPILGLIKVLSSTRLDV
ncbi:hypothetical protein OPV22_031051 [Ensete ventricosum]|uniref:Translation elongation factor EFTu/EF1A C-terminal domain-containing protein n=1 Tax=Ensete ventricosum TaxID=4639 RepID=A0AAV8P075_ENSVE|nr:hypothetical protein OPV22_031051 [Ensete ventricosum]